MVLLAMPRFPFVLIASLAIPLPVHAQAPEGAWGAAFGKGTVKQEAGERERERERGAAQTVAPPAVAPPVSRAAAVQALADAESVVATFDAALASGAEGFERMRSTEEVLAALAEGINGGGRFAEVTFQVPGFDARRQRAAAAYLRVERGRLVVSRTPAVHVRPGLAGQGGEAAEAAATDSRQRFADGALWVEVPEGFSAEPVQGGDLMVRGDGVSVRFHLQAREAGADAVAAVREAAVKAGVTAAIAGSNAYFTLPDRRTPESVVVGFRDTVVQIAVEGEPVTPGHNLLRLRLPALVASLGHPR